MSLREENRAKWIGTRYARSGTDIIMQDVVANGVTVIYTVPALKVFSLISSSLCLTTVGVGNSVMYIKRGAGIIYFLSRLHVITAVGSIADSIYSPSIPMELIAGDTIEISSSAAGQTCRGSIHGEEDDI